MTVEPVDILAIAAQIKAEEDRHRAVCRKKGIYRTVEAAEAGAQQAAARYQEPMFFYRCPVCSMYHLTSKEQSY